MKNHPITILKRFFGYDAFREHQEKIIESLLAGKDAFVLMPTGSGKSICYQIPAMIRSGVGIVISPLIALMENQVKGLKQNGIRAEYLNSTLDFKTTNRIQRQAASGNVDILYVAPERLLTESFQRFLKNIPVGLFAIDEAHCVSQWGHDFRPEYLRINEVTRQFQDVPRVALTATADSVTHKDILEKLDLQEAEHFFSSFDRPNIRYHVQVKQSDKNQLLSFIEKSHPHESGIVYVRTRKRTETIASWLYDKGVSALPYHAGLGSEVRFDHQKRFLENDVDVIVATIAFGLGIDKPDVRFVAHLDLPASLEAYYQETGRAGRNGQPADAWMVYSLSDVVAMNKLFELTPGNEEFKWIQRKKLNALLGYCELIECRRKMLLAYFGETYKGDCQACDNCMHPVKAWDGTVAAQKALSCVYRTGERFGVEYLIDVLLGQETERILKLGHHRLTTFKIGNELDRREWKSVFRQLLSAGYLKAELSSYGGLRLSDKSRPVLRKKQKILFRKDPFSKVKPRAGANKRIRSETVKVMDNEGDNELFEKLRGLRAAIAKKNGVPPYVIFHDRTLSELVGHFPRSLDEMHGIHGIGEAKLRNYGRQFLKVISGHVKPDGAKKSVGSDLKTPEKFQSSDNSQTKDEKPKTKEKIPEEKKKAILRLLRETNLTSAQIAEQIHVSPPVVWAYKAHLRMGTYQDNEGQKRGE